MAMERMQGCLAAAALPGSSCALAFHGWPIKRRVKHGRINSAPNLFISGAEKETALRKVVLVWRPAGEPSSE